MDTIITAVALAAFTVAGFMFLLQKVIGWHGIAKHKAKVDIGTTVAAFFLFAGTSTLGIFVAVISGFLASVITTIIGKMYAKSLEDQLPRKIYDIVPVSPEQRARNTTRTETAMTALQSIINPDRGGNTRH